MDRADQLRILSAAQGDAAELALAVVDLAFVEESHETRQELRRALEAAAVPHWVTPRILAHLLGASDETAAFLLSRLRRLTLLEPFPSRGETACNVHEESRVAIRKRLAVEGRLAELSRRAAQTVDGPAAYEVIECVFHRALFEPQQAALAIEELVRKWRREGRIEERAALAVACDELRHVPNIDDRVRAAAIEGWCVAIFDHLPSTVIEATARELLEIRSREGDPRRLATAFSLLGRGLAQRGEEDQARAAHLEALRLRRAIAPAFEAVTRATEELVREVYASLWWLIDLDVDQRNFVDAQTRVGEALDLTRAMVAAFPDDVEWRRDAAIGLYWLGRVKAEQGNSSEAHAVLEDYLALVRELSNSYPDNPRFRDDVAVALVVLGQLDVARGAKEDAQRRYSEALEIRRWLRIRDPLDVDYARGLTVLLNSLADLNDSAGHIEDARRSLEEAAAIERQRVSRDPAHTLGQRDLAFSLSRLGELAVAEHRFDDARALHEEALATRQQLSRLDPKNRIWRREVELSLDSLGHIALQQQRFAEAGRAFEAALEIATELLRGNPTDSMSIHDVYHSHLLMSQYAQKVGDQKAALAWLESGRPKLEQLWGADPDRWRSDMEWLESEMKRLSE